MVVHAHATAHRGPPLATYAEISNRRLAEHAFPREEVRRHARWLVRAAAHREPLKLAIVLLAVSGTDYDVADLKVLARHDEFALYAAAAAAKLLDDATNTLWEMARNVEGWGKIQVVERLSRRVANRPDIKAWLVRHGCDNSVMPEYLAYICATSGGLAGALAVDVVDDELLDGACIIVRALLRGGPAEDIESYGDGTVAVRRLVQRLETCCNTLDRLYSVMSILAWLEWPTTVVIPGRARLAVGGWGFDDPELYTETWARRVPLGRTVPVRADLARRCEQILQRPEWPEQVRAAYTAEGARDGRQRYLAHLAWRLAPVVGVDLWEEGFAWLAEDPLDSWLYLDLSQAGSLARLRRLMAFAEAHLPLSELASRPEHPPGPRQRSRADRCLEFLLPEMRRAGVFSELLVAAAMRGPGGRNRILAAAALESQPAARWGEPIRTALIRSLADELNDELRERIRAHEARMG